jgi:predicted DNA-binding protein
MPLTVRLTPKTERALNALAMRRRQTRSDVVREAIEHYTSAITDNDTRDRRPYHLWADVIGAVRIGGRNPGKTTGELFTDVVVRKARARRSR